MPNDGSCYNGGNPRNAVAPQVGKPVHATVLRKALPPQCPMPGRLSERLRSASRREAQSPMPNTKSNPWIEIKFNPRVTFALTFT